MKRNLRMKVFIGSDRVLKIIDAYDQKGGGVELSPAEVEQVQYFLSSIINPKTSDENFPPRLLTVLGIQNYGDHFVLISPKDITQN